MSVNKLRLPLGRGYFYAFSTTLEKPTWALQALRKEPAGWLDMDGWHVSHTKEYTSHGPILGRRNMADMVCPPTTSSSGVISSLCLLCDTFSAMLTTPQPPPWPDRSCHWSAALWRRGFEEAMFPLWDHVNKDKRCLFFFLDSHSGVAPEFGGKTIQMTPPIECGQESPTDC